MIDKDVALLLKEIRNESAGDQRVDRWKRAIGKEVQKSRTMESPAFSSWKQLVAASVVGFVFGSGLIVVGAAKSNFVAWQLVHISVLGFEPSKMFALNENLKNVDEDATPEFVLIKN